MYGGDIYISFTNFCKKKPPTNDVVAHYEFAISGIYNYIACCQLITTPTTQGRDIPANIVYCPHSLTGFCQL